MGLYFWELSTAVNRYKIVIELLLRNLIFIFKSFGKKKCYQSNKKIKLVVQYFNRQLTSLE